MPPIRFALLVGAALALSIFAGCTLPKPAYRRIDFESPEFKAAVATELEKLRTTTDLSASAAARQATKNVTRQFIEAEKEQRTRKAAPLAEVMAAFEQPRGCWAYTVEITKREKGLTTVTVENFDPFQPEERLWTLVSRDGQAPDEKAQAKYRAEKLKAWKKSQARQRKHTPSEAVTTQALFANLEIVAPDNEPQASYTFTREGAHIPLVGRGGAFRETYITDRATSTLLRRTRLLLEPLSLFIGSAKIEHFQSATDYIVVEPGTAPFAAKAAIRFRGSFFGDERDVDQEMVYSNYRRVKCYDDRFEVKVGPPDVVDFIPDKN